MAKYGEAIKYVESIFILRQKMLLRHLLLGGMFLLLQRYQMWVDNFSITSLNLGLTRPFGCRWLQKLRTHTIYYGKATKPRSECIPDPNVLQKFQTFWFQKCKKKKKKKKPKNFPKTVKKMLVSGVVKDYWKKKKLKTLPDFGKLSKNYNRIMYMSIFFCDCQSEKFQCHMPCHVS